MNTFYFEMTDTFGGDLNYCWLKRFKINAKNLKGALIKLSKETGFNFRNNGSYYKAKTLVLVRMSLILIMLNMSQKIQIG